MMELAMASKTDTGIPAFLLIDKKEAARRRKWNEEHPVQPVSFSGKSEERLREVELARAKIDAEKKASERVRLDSVHARKKMEKEAEAQGAYAKPIPGAVWNPAQNRYVHPNYMPRRKFERLLAEMPTEGHRTILKQRFGTAGQATATVMVDTPAPRKARAAAPAKPKAKAKAAAAPATRAKRGGKPEQVAAVEAMLTRPEGATLSEIGAKFGWLDHTASAFLSVNFRNLGRPTVKATEAGRGTVYRLEEKK